MRLVRDEALGGEWAKEGGGVGGASSSFYLEGGAIGMRQLEIAATGRVTPGRPLLREGPGEARLGKSN